MAERFVAHAVAEVQVEVTEEIEEAEANVRRELHEIAQRLVDLERRLPGGA